MSERIEKFTPGPWNYKDACAFIQADNDTIICELPHNAVMMIPEDDHNMRLCAAAPELYASARLQDDADKAYDSGDERQWRRLSVMASNMREIALKKALGGIR